MAKAGSPRSDSPGHRLPRLFAFITGRPWRDHLPMLLLAAIVAAASIDGILLILEMESGWRDSRIHVPAAAALVAVAAGCVWFVRLLETRPSADQLASAERARMAAETANHAKSRYLASVSHEIRSPLNAIYGYAQLVEQDADLSPKQAARVIRRCAEHMTGLIESLLDISRLENGVLRVRSEVVQLAPFIEQVLMMMRPAAAAKGLEFIYEPPAHLPDFVRMDPSRLRQILLNLLSNAIKFTDRGRVTLRVSYSWQVATFEVIDTGPGIPPESLDRIFVPFDRGGEGADASPGVGLGLPISRAIAEILGGQLDVRSTPGEGSCFRVRIMLAEVASVVSPDTAIRRTGSYEGTRRSILVVDDDPDQRSFIERFLKASHFDVLGVPNGETALAISMRRTFDLAILDISLPGISGWETAVHLRERAGPDLRILMLSANAHEFHRPDFPQPVHDSFLVKPVKLDTLAETIGGLLKLSWKWETPDTVAGPPAPAGFKPASPATAARTNAATAAVPDGVRAHAARLRELLRIGYVRGIEHEINAIAAIVPAESQFLRDLHDCLDRLDLAAMARILEGV